MLIQNIILIILTIIDANYNLYIINGANSNDFINNRKWHKWGSLLAMGFGLTIGYLSNNYLLSGLYLSYRATTFPLVLNLLREKPIFYLSKNGFEGIFAKRNLEWLYFLGGFFFILLFNYLKFH